MKYQERKYKLEAITSSFNKSFLHLWRYFLPHTVFMYVAITPRAEFARIRAKWKIEISNYRSEQLFSNPMRNSLDFASSFPCSFPSFLSPSLFSLSPCFNYKIHFFFSKESSPVLCVLLRGCHFSFSAVCLTLV